MRRPIRCFRSLHCRLFVLTLALSRTAEGQSPGGHPSDSPPDTGFAALQSRGAQVMGVDQYSSVHRFDDLPDGGRIALERDSTDTAGVRAIREHLAGIALEFAAGDFEEPGLVHEHEVPGTATMRTRRAVIRYEFKLLPGGGEVRITTENQEALEAVHTFLAFQRHEHHAGGMVHVH